MKNVLFARKYSEYSGGHQKVLDYFEHCLAHEHLSPGIYWSPESEPIELTPWLRHRDRVVPEYDPAACDLVFVAGLDWRIYEPLQTDPDLPVVNLIQHVRHADPASDVYPFLTERAIRICVSPEVQAAIESTGRVNGPLYTIANGVAVDKILAYRSDPEPGSVYILGNKQPELASQLAHQLSGQGLLVSCHTEHTPREQILSAMGGAEIAVLLPHATEGFYLPALEAMALSQLVIVPDCVGNRSFCQAGHNCLMPGLELNALVESVHRARKLLSESQADSFRLAAETTLSQHSLQRERKAFYAILDNLEQIW